MRNKIKKTILWLPLLVITVCCIIHCQRNTSDVTTHSQEALILYTQGVEYSSQGHFTKAINSLEKAVEADPNFAMAYCRLSMAYNALGRKLDAEAACRKAVKHSSNVSPKEKLFISSWQAEINHNFQYATELLIRFVKDYPRDKEGFLRLATDYYKRQHYDKATNLLHKALRIDANYIPALSMLAYCYANKGMYNEAIAQLKKCISLAPEQTKPYDSLGDIYRFAGRYDEAINEYNKAIELRPDFYPAYYHLGDVYFEKGMYEQAINQYTTAFELLPQTPTNESMKYSTQGYIYLKKGQLKSALEKSTKAVELDAENMEAYWIRGQVFVARKLFKQALTEANTIKACIERQNLLPFNTDCIYYDLLGKISLAQNRFDDAIRQYKTALLKSTPINKPYYHHALAEVYFQMGNLDEAIAECKEAFELNPNYAISHYLIAQIYEKRGMSVLAAEEYEKFLAIWNEADQNLADVLDAQARLIIVRRQEFAGKR